MNTNTLLDEIKSRGYWRIELHSVAYHPNTLPNREAMQNLLHDSSVSFRGWPYPFFLPEKSIYNGKWLEEEENFEYSKEYWRLYKSGQWLHYLSLHGAWLTHETVMPGRRPLPPQHQGYTHVRNDILYTLTEALHFAVGFATAGVFDPAAYIDLQLHNTYDYMLYESSSRFFTDRYVNQSEVPFEYKTTIPSSELIGAADKIALAVSIDVYGLFGWIPTEAAMRTLVEDQKKLVERRL